MLVDLEAMESVDWFDENTFLYAEEQILSEKLQKNGYKVLYLPYVSVLHYHGFTTKRIPVQKKVKIALQSEMHCYKNYRNYGLFKLCLIKIGILYKHYVLYGLKDFLNVIYKETIKNRQKRSESNGN